jgi:hypothetical protein
VAYTVSYAYDLNNAQHHLKETDPPLPSIGQVKKALNALKLKKATGIDGIPAWFLKQYSEDLAPVAHNIITSSTIQCKYPTLYKQALITPVPKITPPKNIETDFRLISVLPQLAKVLEKIQLQLNCADLTLKDNQHAFRKGRSTISALLRCVNDWVKKLLVSSAFWESSEFRRTISVFFSNMTSMRVVFILYMINRRFWQETVSVLIPIVVIVCLKVAPQASLWVLACEWVLKKKFSGRETMALGTRLAINRTKSNLSGRVTLPHPLSRILTLIIYSV